MGLSGLSMRGSRRNASGCIYVLVFRFAVPQRHDLDAMTQPTPTFAGEVQFRRYSDTSTQGTQIVLALPDRESLQSFIGLEGKRFMAVLVQIGDDEQPVTGNPVSANAVKSHIQREPLGDLCWRAVQWCREPEFQEWISKRVQVSDSNPPVERSEQSARRLICAYCDVTSRKELDTNPEAARKFNQLIRGPYQKHLIARGIVR